MMCVVTTAIDFTRWTDAQLEATLHVTNVESSPNYPALKAEHDRRVASGADDGSKARVASMIARNPGLHRRRPRR